MPYGTGNTLFMTLCILLVLLMQAGFLCLEAGAVRSKNTVNVAAKNLVDLILVTLVYSAIGFTIQYGWFSDFSQSAHPKGPHYPYLFLLFQTLFAATAATIVSGAVSERCGLRGYMIISLVIVILIYPVSGQWVWGGVFDTPQGWLARIGFIDFAGSTQVHALGGAVALASVMIIGPRKGFSSQNYRVFRGQNQTMSLLGVMLLWLGWFGFNMGSLLKVDSLSSLVMVNTFVSACAGGIACLIWSTVFYHKADIPVIANGVLAGLVGITAGAHAMVPASAVLTGAIAGLVCCGMMVMLEHYKIDDVIGAIPVHLGAGIWGTIAVALLGDPHILKTGNNIVMQLGIQLLGCFVVVLWAFIVSYALLKLINHWFPLRVSEESERIGLNISEHGATSELSDIIHDLDLQANTGDYKPLDHDTFSELSGITQQYNRILKHFLDTESRLAFNLQALQKMQNQLTKEKASAESANHHKSLFMSKLSQEIRTPLNNIITMSELLRDEAVSEDKKESLNIINQSGHALLDVIDDVIDYTRLEAGELSLEAVPFELSQLLKQCQQVFQMEANAKGVQISVNIDLGTHDKLIADSKRLRQVLINLLGNACRSTDKGSISLSADTTHNTGNLIIEIADTGRGIPPEQLDTLFDAMAQEQYSASLQANNSGLGLAICKELIELMGGTISVVSEVNKGTCFTLQIPVTGQS